MKSMNTMLRNLFCAALLCISLKGIAQFTITETFRGSSSAGVTLGGSAVLTSGSADPVGDGWLRLTPATNNQLGYAYVNSTFPSSLGVLVDFEYTAWRGSASGADGFSVFLFDATTSPFSIGGVGGSLGYAQYTSVPTDPGLSGGYLGIGVDEFGNYSSTVNGKSGGPGNRPNSVAARGPAPNYTYISGIQIIASDAGAGDNGGVDYNTLTATRPTQAQFYRRLQFELLPVGPGFQLTVKWKKNPASPFTTLLGPTTLATAPPTLLRVGFAASTGGSINTHEVRNVIITTPGNISVNKSANLINNFPGTPTTIPYTIVVANGTAGTVSGVSFADPLPVGYTATLADISINTHSNPASQVQNLAISPAGLITADLNIAAKEEIIFTINGKLTAYPPGGQLTNIVTVGSGNITDLDQTNNTSQSNTMIVLTLPLTLKSFVARRSDDHVQLDWITTAEQNFSHTEIERSADGAHFVLRGKVPAQPAAGGDKHYQYPDAAALAGTLYYRLKLVDMDGKFTYSTIRKIDNRQQVDTWKIYPNPASINTVVYLPASWQQGTTGWTLVDMLGNKVASGTSKTTGLLQIPVTAIPNGRYNLVLRHQQKGIQHSLPLQVSR